MNKNDFLEEIRIQFEETDSLNIKMDTVFDTLDTWDSLTRFSIIESIKDNYNVEIKDFDKITTPKDLFNYIIENSN